MSRTEHTCEIYYFLTRGAAFFRGFGAAFTTFRPLVGSLPAPDLIALSDQFSFFSRHLVAALASVFSRRSLPPVPQDGFGHHRSERKGRCRCVVVRLVLLSVTGTVNQIQSLLTGRGLIVFEKKFVLRAADLLYMYWTSAMSALIYSI